GDQPAQIGPAAGAVPGEEGDPGRRFVDEGTAAHRGAAPLPADGPVTLRRGRSHRQLRAEQGADAGRGAGLGETDGPGEAVAVGEDEGVHAPFAGARSEERRVGEEWR